MNQGQNCLWCQLESLLLNFVSSLCGVWSNLASVLVGSADKIKAMTSSMRLSMMMTSFTSELKILNLNR